MTWQEAVILLDTIPGVNVRTAEVILAEIRISMFASGVKFLDELDKSVLMVHE